MSSLVSPSVRAHVCACVCACSCGCMCPYVLRVCIIISLRRSYRPKLSMAHSKETRGPLVGEGRGRQNQNRGPFLVFFAVFRQFLAIFAQVYGSKFCFVVGCGTARTLIGASSPPGIYRCNVIFPSLLTCMLVTVLHMYCIYAFMLYCTIL